MTTTPLHNPSSDERFVELTVRYLDGVDDDASHAELTRMVRDDPRLRRRFRELCQLAMAMGDHAVGEVDVLPAIDFPVATRPAWVGRAVAAVLAVGLFVGWLAMVWSRDDGPVVDPPARLGPVVAVMQMSEGAVWASDPLETGEDVRTGDIRLDAGVVELEFHSGAVVRVTGPAVFRPRSAESADLLLGTAHARVDHGGGFRIVGPRFAVVDLGTEFGVHVEPDGSGEVLVFDGSVELRAGTEVTKLTAGEGSSIATDGRVTRRPDRGVRVSTPRIVYLENFANAHPTDRPLIEAGWQVHKTGGRPADAPVLSYVGSGSPDPVASNPPPTTLTDAFMLTLDPESNVDYLYWTDETPLGVNDWRPVRFTWIERHDIAEQATRLALRIGANWYVSERLEPPDDEAAGRRRTVDVDRQSWRRLMFVDGQVLEIGDPARLPQDDITAFGFYVERRVGFKLRFDSVQIDAVPALWWTHENENRPSHETSLKGAPR